MFAVLRGKNIDIPNQQRQIEEFRDKLGLFSFSCKVVKDNHSNSAETKYMVLENGHIAQPYWMSLMRVWLQSLDEALEKEIDSFSKCNFFADILIILTRMQISTMAGLKKESVLLQRRKSPRNLSAPTEMCTTARGD